jgi:hypothetical protein
MSPYHPYYYEPQHYGYSNHPPPQGGDGSSSGNVPPSVPPYAMYPPPGMAGWYPPPPPPPPLSNPSAPPNIPHQNAPAPVSRGMPQGQQQPPQQQPPVQAPYFNPVAAPFYPQPFPITNFDPAASQSQQQQPPPHILPQQGHIAPLTRVSSGTLYSPQDDSKAVGLGSSRFNSSSRGSSRNNVREATGAAAGRIRANNGSSPGPRNPSQLPRTPWSYGSGSGLAIPMAVGNGGRRSGSSSSRAGSVSSRSGSAGAMTPADETGSIAVSVRCRTI